MNRPPVPIPRWLGPCIVLCLVVSAWSISHRMRVESRNRAVTLAAEMDAVEQLAGAEGMSLPQALRKLSGAGYRAIVLSEETIGDLVRNGVLEWKDGELRGSEEVMASVRAGLERRFPKGAIPVRTDPDVGSSMTVPLGPIRGSLSGVSVGLDSQAVRLAQEAGLSIIGRYGNPIGVNSTYVVETVRHAKTQGVAIFLPQGDQVLGRREALGVLRDSLAQQGILYASPEFTRLGGDAESVARAPKNAVRLHSAQAAELDKLPLADAVERYSRAARERNQRVLLLRPLDFAGDAPLTRFAQFGHQIVRDIAKGGMKPGTAHPFGEPGVPRWLFVLLGLAMSPVVWFTAKSFVPRRPIRVAGAALLVLLGLACWWDPGRTAMAFAGALAFPIAAFLILDARRGRSWPVEFALVTAVSLIGGLCVAGLLNELKFLIRADQFTGVKAAVFLPVLVVGWHFLARLSDVRGSLRASATWGQLALAFVILAAFALMITRTGNDNPAAVSGLELKLRSMLDALLVVRPRTKEFLIGHPFLILGISMLIRMRRDGPPTPGYGGWAALALMIGAVGQTDIVNTLCHLHTPVDLSLMRIGVGFIAGGILGAALTAAVGRITASKGS